MPLTASHTALLLTARGLLVDHLADIVADADRRLRAPGRGTAADSSRFASWARSVLQAATDQLTAADVAPCLTGGACACRAAGTDHGETAAPDGPTMALLGAALTPLAGLRSGGGRPVPPVRELAFALDRSIRHVLATTPPHHGAGLAHQPATGDNPATGDAPVAGGAPAGAHRGPDAAPAGDRRVHRVLLADDQTLFREGLRALLHDEPDFEVAGESRGGNGAAATAAALRPDLVLLGAHQPDGEDALDDTIGRLASSPVGCRILVLAARDDARLVRRSMAAGAHGYLVTSAGLRELVAAMRAVCHPGGRGVLNVSVKSLRCLDHHTGQTLSVRESEVLTLAAHAYSNARIASQLYITEATVKRHLTNAYTKLHARSRIEAINKASAAGLLHGSGGAAGMHPGS